MESQYTAIIVEPRKHRAFEYVLNNFTKSLDTRWRFIVFHGTTNETFVKNIIDKNENSNRIQMINLYVENLTIHDYNKLFYDKTFYSNIPTEVFLIFQTDTIICEKFKDRIYDFVEYDYVGAPWVNRSVGNGGLSLRRKSKMLEILDKCSDLKYNNHGNYYNEDFFFSRLSLSRLIINIPSYEKAQEFSIETVHNKDSFGIHNCWRYLSADNLKNVLSWCDELHELILLNQPAKSSNSISIQNKPNKMSLCLF
jgi:hypothetical protein